MQADPVNQDTTISTPKKRGRPRIDRSNMGILPTTLKARRNRKIDPIKALQLEAKGYTQEDIANKFNITQGAVSQSINKIKSLILEPNELKAYRNHEADLIDSIKAKIITAASNEDTIKKAPFGTLSLAFCQLYDKSALILGKSTQNINIRSINDHLFNQANELEQQIKALSEQDATVTP